MADENTPKPSMGLEVAFASEGSTSGEFGAGESSVSTSTSDGASMDFNADGSVVEKPVSPADPELEGEEADGNPEQPEGGDTEGDGEPDAEGNGEAPDGDPFDPDDAESVEAFNAKYIGEDGGLNMEAFTDELQGNVTNGVFDLNKSTRAWLNNAGISNALINQHLQGVKAMSEANDNAFYSLAGGKESYDKKFAWAKENFTPAQKERYNKAMAKGGDAAQEQLELLNTRYAAGNPNAGTETPAKKGFGFGAPKRPASPQRDATNNASAKPTSQPKAQGYANAEEHRAAMNEALASKNPAKMEEVRARLRASSWFVTKA